MKPSLIVLGGGCFWCLEAAYQQLEGVEEAVPGYSGGSATDASYDRVSSGSTDQVEVVRVSFRPEVRSLEQILAVFWLIHDPTSRNRQGADVGPQYASIIFYASSSQHRAILASRDEAQRQLRDKIVTRIEPLEAFYEAEPYHHNYFQTHPDAAYCQIVIEPKLQKLRQHFSSLLSE